jgi:polysaccharide export outer membrane protein
MLTRRGFIVRTAALPALTGTGLSGCAALPRSGPTTFDMRGSDDPEALEGLVARLTRDTLAAIPAPPPPSFPEDMRAASPIDPTRIGVDDVLQITLWESEGAGLFNPDGGATVITTIVDPDGRIPIPFAGQLQARGDTVAALRDTIRSALTPYTLQPQVDVRLMEPRSRLVALQGAVASPGLVPIERPTLHLASMIARVGGATGDPERVEIAIRRGERIERQLLSEMLGNPALDIALRPGDLITLSPIRERFIVLGASSAQAEISFPTRPLTLLSALGAARGLRDFDADPSGVFVIRYEDPTVADALLPGERPPDLPGGPGRPIVYRLDLSEPEGLFLARGFRMRDGDAIFVTNAPLTELRKFLQLFNSVVTPVNTVDNFSL